MNNRLEKMSLVDFDLISKIFDILGDKKTKVVLYILSKSYILSDDSFVYIGTISDICNETLISKPTVINTVKRLEDVGAIKKEKPNMWVISAKNITL